MHCWVKGQKGRIKKIASVSSNSRYRVETSICFVNNI